jgi:hypothetical protein
VGIDKKFVHVFFGTMVEPGLAIEFVEWFSNGDGEGSAGLLLPLSTVGGAGRVGSFSRRSCSILAAKFLVVLPVCLLAFA